MFDTIVAFHLPAMTIRSMHYALCSFHSFNSSSRSRFLSLHSPMLTGSRPIGRCWRERRRRRCHRGVAAGIQHLHCLCHTRSKDFRIFFAGEIQTVHLEKKKDGWKGESNRRRLKRKLHNVSALFLAQYLVDFRAILRQSRTTPINPRTSRRKTAPTCASQNFLTEVAHLTRCF